MTNSSSPTAIGARSFKLVKDVRPMDRATALFAHVVEIDGQLVGGWKRTTQGKSVVVTTTYLARMNDTKRRAVAAQARRYGAFSAFPSTWPDARPRQPTRAPSLRWRRRAPATRVDLAARQSLDEHPPHRNRHDRDRPRRRRARESRSCRVNSRNPHAGTGRSIRPSRPTEVRYPTIPPADSDTASVSRRHTADAARHPDHGLGAVGNDRYLQAVAKRTASPRQLARPGDRGAHPASAVAERVEHTLEVARRELAVDGDFSYRRPAERPPIATLAAVPSQPGQCEAPARPARARRTSRRSQPRLPPIAPRRAASAAGCPVCA